MRYRPRHLCELAIPAAFLFSLFIAGDCGAAPASSGAVGKRSTTSGQPRMPQVLDSSKNKALDGLFLESMTSSTTGRLSAVKLTFDEFMELAGTGQVTQIKADIPQVKELPNWLKNITSTNPDCNPAKHLPDPDGKGTWTTILPSLGGAADPSAMYRAQMCVHLCEKKAQLRNERFEETSCNKETAEKEILERIDFWKRMLDTEYQYWKFCFNHDGLEHILEQPPRKDDHVKKFYDSIQALINCLTQKKKSLASDIYASPWFWELKKLYPGFQSDTAPAMWQTEPQPSVRPIQVQNPPAGFPGDWTLWCIPIKPGPPSTAPAAGVGNATVGGLKCLLRKAGGVGAIFIGLPFLPGYQPPQDDPYNPPNVY